MKDEAQVNENETKKNRVYSIEILGVVHFGYHGIQILSFHQVKAFLGYPYNLMYLYAFYESKLLARNLLRNDFLYLSINYFWNNFVNDIEKWYESEDFIVFCI